ncbi:MAG: preprotein translocase subunit YajC [Clostridia bacterium]|nr:preprotein translocase subunit YajC [Clostridia bacterium]
MPANFVESVATYLPVIIILIASVLIMIIPQKKKDKKFKEMLEGLKVGNRIKTIGCIYGRVVSIKEDLIVIETGPDKTTLEISKDAIAAVENGEISKDTK